MAFETLNDVVDFNMVAYKRKPVSIKAKTIFVMVACTDFISPPPYSLDPIPRKWLYYPITAR